MRTTLTLDADVARTLKTAVSARKVPFKKVVNDALRAGLGLQTMSRPSVRFTVRTHGGGFAPGLDPQKLNKLAAELEDEATLRKLMSP